MEKAKRLANRQGRWDQILPLTYTLIHCCTRCLMHVLLTEPVEASTAFITSQRPWLTPDTPALSCFPGGGISGPCLPRCKSIGQELEERASIAQSICSPSAFPAQVSYHVFLPQKGRLALVETAAELQPNGEGSCGTVITSGTSTKLVSFKVLKDRRIFLKQTLI